LLFLSQNNKEYFTPKDLKDALNIQKVKERVHIQREDGKNICLKLILLQNLHVVELF